MAFKIAKASPSYFPKAKPMKSKGYLAFLHDLPCVVTGKYGVQAAHVSFINHDFAHHGRAKTRKASDIFALPLCPEEHDRQHRHPEGEQGYWREVGINPHLLALKIWAEWSQWKDDPEEAIEFATRHCVVARAQNSTGQRAGM
ncbi:DUF968 domain-containing protein [Martelella lutilitoris]|uniref:DUF968 domain-containing protein n=1 Tax=Martelella lutilitoris TaxID=2583532 RepID=A0A7T7HHL3_9HYPH|nr:DUF968 domain-containing protein [Martelella lutilitoris]QQM29341.1 DUF968 domain-containing protein [Martelella lutilitoris]